MIQINEINPIINVSVSGENEDITLSIIENIENISIITSDIGLQGNIGPQGDTGPQGSQGPIGPQGNTGADSVIAGPIGPIGLTGPQGLQGVKGNTGADSIIAGPQGLQGLQGVKGNTGADSVIAGPQGIQGAIGPQGVKGDTGSDSIIAGPQGPIGLTGPQGIKGNTGADSIIAGPQGIQGLSGATGPQGPQGNTGADSIIAGPQGIQGLSGATGPQGNTGADSIIAGPQGIQGLSGATGPQGNTGPIGPQGATGTAGLTGAVGTNGINGVDGATGLTGLTGATGLTGLTGPQGVKGDTGIQGEIGPQGIQADISGKVDKVTGERLINALEITKLSNQSGTNTGDNAVNSNYSGLVSNVPTTLTVGTITATTYGVTSDGSVDDIILPEANTTQAGLLGAGKWNEIVANTAKVGITTGQASAITINTAKISFDSTSSTRLANTSGTNTGDNATNTQYSGLVSNATHTGDVTGATSLTLATVNANVGIFSNASLTVNAKGLVTAVSSGASPITTETDPTVPAYSKSLTAFSVIKSSTDALYVTGTGTTNYLSKFTGSTILGNSLINDNGTGIGIGGVAIAAVKLLVVDTTTATYLRVQGKSDGDNYSALELWDDAGASKWQFAHKSIAGQTKAFVFTHWNGTSWISPMIIQDNGNVGVGSVTDNGAKFVVTGSTLLNGSTFKLQSPPVALTVTTTLTITQLLTSLFTVTSAAAVSLTLPTGTLTEAGVLSGLAPINTSFDWYILNRGSSTGVVTMVAGTGHTFVGLATIPINSQSMFTTVKTAANTFITYRKS
ncbi:hypothetical protein ACNQGL_07635 [Flavobacterium sp. LB3P21]|uniref:hypothetical protein n=1 Tax=Flavobacterium sp. LB3P21 TaxID=3401719 RepID=UPI003AAB9DFF